MCGTIKKESIVYDYCRSVSCTHVDFELGLIQPISQTLQVLLVMENFPKEDLRRYLVQMGRR